MMPYSCKRSFLINWTLEQFFFFLSRFVKFYSQLTKLEKVKAEDFWLKLWPFKHGQGREKQTHSWAFILEKNMIPRAQPTTRWEPAQMPGAQLVFGREKFCAFISSPWFPQIHSRGLILKHTALCQVLWVTFTVETLAPEM